MESSGPFQQERASCLASSHRPRGYREHQGCVN